MRGLHKSYRPPLSKRASSLQEEKSALLKRIDIIRFLEKCGDPNERGCWPWLGSIVHSRRVSGMHAGNGSFRWEDSSKMAHRISYEIHIGPIPRGLCVRHKCDNSICVNPEHLELGTAKDNNHDKAIRGRAARKLTAAQVQKIRADKRIGRVIGADYGVGQITISNIKTKRSWAWLT